MVYDLQSPLDVERIRKDFPILDRRLAGGRPLVYLDSANTSQKPRAVLDALSDHYERHNANVARAVHQLGDQVIARPLAADVEDAEDVRMVEARCRPRLALESVAELRV